MVIHQEDRFSIFFGDKCEQFIPANFHGISSHQILAQEPFIFLQKNLPMRNLLFLHQVHGIDGFTIVNEDQILAMKTFTHDGDFLITNRASIGLGIATADCLPIIFYDQINHAVAIAHAGWRGSVAKIAQHVVDQMHKYYKTNVHSIQIFFGPSAKACCYEVNDDFCTYLENIDYAHTALINRNKKKFFNLPLFNQLLLQQYGIKTEAFNYSYNFCTLCNESYCSFRRMHNNYRQMTIVNLLE